MIEPLVISFDVASSVEHAFRVWTSAIASWWPKEHTVSAAPDVDVVLEGGLGGRIYERTATGVEHEWGEVTLWDPPARFGYLWHIRRDRADATDVEISFTEVADEVTRVDIVHTGWDRLGAGGQRWRDRNVSGWDAVLPHVRAAIERG